MTQFAIRMYMLSNLQTGKDVKIETKSQRANYIPPSSSAAIFVEDEINDASERPERRTFCGACEV